MSVAKLIDHAVANGAVIDQRLKFQQTESCGISAFVDCNQESNNKQISIEIPNNLIVKPEDAFDALGVDKQEKPLEESIIFKFYLACLKTKLISNETFQPYIELLPSLEEITSPLSMDAKALYVFDNTSLQKTYIGKKLEILKLDHSSARAIFPQDISFDDYLWAHLIVTSRAFPNKIVNPYAESHSVMLLPVIDLLNHQPGSKVQWSSSGSGNFKLTNLQEIPLAGQYELFNNYGPKGNAELLMGYGFVLEENEFDILQLSLSLPEAMKTGIMNEWNVRLPTLADYTYNINKSTQKNVIQSTQKKEGGEDKQETTLCQEMSEDATLFMLNKFHPIPDGLLEVFSYINKNENDSGLTLKNVMNGLHQLKQSLELKYMDKLDKVPPFHSDLISEHSYKNAKVFRQGQLKIYNMTKNAIKSKEKFYLKEYRKHFTTVKDIYKKDTAEFQDFIEILQWDKPIEQLNKMEMELIFRLWLMKTVNYWNLGNIGGFGNFDVEWFLELFEARKKDSQINQAGEDDDFMTDLYEQIVPVLKQNVPELIRGDNWTLHDWLVIDRLVSENSYEKGKNLEPLLIKPMTL